MSGCVNEKCNKGTYETIDSVDSVLATPDGDFSCCVKCLEEFKKQREHFFANIGNDKFYNNWMNGNI